MSELVVWDSCQGDGLGGTLTCTARDCPQFSSVFGTTARPNIKYFGAASWPNLGGGGCKVSKVLLNYLWLWHFSSPRASGGSDVELWLQLQMFVSQVQLSCAAACFCLFCCLGSKTEIPVQLSVARDASSR